MKLIEQKREVYPAHGVQKRTAQNLYKVISLVSQNIYHNKKQKKQQNIRSCSKTSMQGRRCLHQSW